MAQNKKSADQVQLPVDIRYHKEHTWARQEGAFIRVGISDFAQDQLGEIIFIELPDAGQLFDQGQAFGCAESTKSVSNLYMPVSGEIVEIHAEVTDNPEDINQDPYGNGWMLLLKPKTPQEYENLLSADGYRQSLVV